MFTSVIKTNIDFSFLLGYVTWFTVEKEILFKPASAFFFLRKNLMVRPFQWLRKAYVWLDIHIQMNDQLEWFSV